MENRENVDSLLAHLLSMGFELSECQRAVEAGKLNADLAVEWIMNDRAGKSSSHSDTLRLRLPAANQSDQSAMTSQFDRQQATSGFETSSTGPLASSDDVAGKHVVSRMHLSDKQREEKERFRDKEREKIKRTIQQQRAAEAKAKEAIRLQIEEDRQRRRERQERQVVHQSEISRDGTAARTKSPTSAAVSCDSAIAECSLQLRLPSGRVLRQKFPTDTSLQDVVDEIVDQENIKGVVSLFQPFPRREYANSDMNKSLRGVGLFPTGSLVLRVEDNPTPMDTRSDHAQQVDLSQTDSWRDGQRLGDTSISSQGQQQATASQSVGSGVVDLPDASSPLDQDDEQEEPEQSEDEDMDVDDQAAVDQPLPAMFHPPGYAVAAGHPGYHIHSHAWGSGQKLGGDGHQGEDERREEEGANDRVASDAAREAAIKRWTSPHSEVEEVHKQRDELHSRLLQSLTDLCVVAVARRLPGYLVHNPLLNLAAVPEAVANRILKVLIGDKALRAKTLHAFLHCRLQKLTLNCYAYTTNELLQAIGLHTSLLHLTASGCPLITDQGIGGLAELKRLRTLNLSSCQQLSDKSIGIIKRFRNLVVLRMDHTKISDSGVSSYTTSAPPSLHHVSLCGTALTDRGLQALAGIEHLHSLEIEDTQIRSLSSVAHMKHLQLLSVANCSQLSDANLADIAGHPSLTGLNLRGCTVGDAGLQYLSGLGLRMLKLPQRHHVTDQGVASLSELPLSSLDLTDFIKVTDVGVKALATVTSLQDLSLANTKVTDDGLRSLSALVSLTSLNLDKTAITSQGATVISNFRLLKMLSLSYTRIGNKLLKSLALNYCFQLQKLNLSHTSVSDKGIQALHLSQLTHLNLDSTRVTLLDPTVMSGLPKVWSLRHHHTQQTQRSHQHQGEGDESDSEEEAEMT